MEVWSEIQKNVEDGTRRLVSEYGNRLFAAAIGLCRNDQDAEDLVFRTFEQAVKKIRLYEPSGDFFCWLYTIMLNFRRMDLRRNTPNIVSVGSAQDLPEQAYVTLPDVSGLISSDRLLAALRALPEATRAVVVLKYFEERSVEEIAAQLAVPIGTIKSRLFNARRALCDMLTNDEHEHERQLTKGA